MVEFALALPVMLVLCLGMLDIGQAVYHYNTISNCAREGARFGIILTDRPTWDAYYGHDPWAEPGNVPDTVLRAANAYVGTVTITGKAAAQAGTLDESKLMVSISPAPGGLNAGIRLPLSVEVRYPFKPLLSNLFGNATITLKAKSMMRLQ
ncbi:MAG: TadE/TadG family type IV pilus assembly protein [Chloroflexota bacterium]